MILKINNIPQFTEWPISAPFGSIDATHHAAHKGVDFAINLGTKVPSFCDGTIIKIDDEGIHSFGKSVHVLTNNGDEVIYGHLSQFKCHVGQYVHAGDTIALSGSTGQSTGPHLHIQVMHDGAPVDPLTYFHMSGDTGTTGIPWLDAKSEMWKQNAERIFHIGGNDAVNDPGFGIMNMLQEKIIVFFQHIGQMLNDNSAEIATFAIIVCAFGVIISPLIGSQPSKWYGRMTGAFFGGVIWRVALTATN